MHVPSSALTSLPVSRSVSCLLALQNFISLYLFSKEQQMTLLDINFNNEAFYACFLPLSISLSLFSLSLSLSIAYPLDRKLRVNED